MVAPFEPVVESTDEGVLVRGYAMQDVHEALKLLEHAARLRTIVEHAATAQIVEALLPASINPVPTTAERRARRIVQLRARLLQEGAYSYEDLADANAHSSAAVARSWASSNGDRLVKVTIDGRTRIPAFQLTEDLRDIRPAVARINRALKPIDGWDAWVWWTSTTSLLSGARPVDLVDTQTDRVERAARRFAAPRSGITAA